jgi:phytoene synthase
VGHASHTSTDPADRLGFRAARDVCRRHGTDFYFATAFLPRAKRDAAHAVFAFCRMAREALTVCDEEPSAARQMRERPLTAPAGGGGGCCSAHPLDGRLALFRDRLEEIYSGHLELPSPASRSEAQHVLHAFGRAVRRFQVPRECFLDLAEALCRDQVVRRYATWASLERHFNQSTGSVCVAMACVLGLTNSGAAEHAKTFGVARRLTRAILDLTQDVARGTIYLPLEDLARFRYSERDLAAGVVNANLRELVRFEVDRARRLLGEAAGGLCWVAGDGSRLTAATLVAWSAGLLDAVERQRYDVLSRRAVLTRGQKLRRLPLAWRLARRRADSTLPAAFPVAELDPVPAAASR